MFYSDKRFLYLMLIVLVLMRLMGMSGIEWVILLLTIPGVLVAITFHEFAHAYVATKLGDDTPMLQNRLNLNPLSHIDPIGFALLLFAGFGWGKPVAINPRNFNHKYSQTASEAIVAAAGPIMNFILAIVFTLLYCVILRFATSFAQTSIGDIIVSMIQYAIIVNLGLGIFNLIPLPPLDGSKILINFLSYNAKQWIYDHESIFYIIFLVIWITGLAGNIISPILNFLYTGLIHIGASIFGIMIM